MACGGSDRHFCNRKLKKGCKNSSRDADSLSAIRGLIYNEEDDAAHAIFKLSSETVKI